MRLGILICYESIFPEIAHQAVIRGANLLVNLTNDAWYGWSSAPHQSLAMAVFRAVENKRTLIRAANTGISGFVDPLGHVVRRSDLFVEASMVGQVPMVEISTVFNRGGGLFAACCAFGGLLMVLVPARRRRDSV
jgi:apolipoprotein N-acyltransferase